MRCLDPRGRRLFVNASRSVFRAFVASPHRLRPGTSPHTLRIPPRDGHPVLRSTSSSGFRSVLLVSSFRLRALRDLSIPSSRFGQRGITPAFGYGAPHPSAGGTSTLLIWALPSARRVGGGALDCSRAGLRPPLSWVEDWRAGFGRDASRPSHVSSPRHVGRVENWRAGLAYTFRPRHVSSSLHVARSVQI